MGLNFSQLLEAKRQIKELKAEKVSLLAKQTELLAKIAELEQKSTVLIPAGTIDANLMYAILEEKVRELGDTSAEIFISDIKCKIYNKEDVKDFQGLEEVASIKYIAEEHDCDDFASELYGKFAGLVWTNVHALNHFVDEMETLWYIEPQTKKLSQVLEDWQGNDIRFLLVR